MIALLLYGCVVPEAPVLPTDDDEPVDTDVPTPDPPTRPEVPCSPTLDLELGTPGDHGIDGFDFEWINQSGDAGSPAITFRLPEDLLSLQIIGLGEDPQAPVSMGAMQLDGEIISSRVNRTPYFNAQVNTVLPTGQVTDLAVDVPSGGHCLTFQLLGASSLIGSTGQLQMITRRGGELGQIDLNLVFVGGSEDRLNQTELDEMVAQIEATWNRSGGPTVGDVGVYTLAGNSIVSQSEAIQATAAGVEPDVLTAVDVFFFDDVTGTESGLLGFAGGVPGVNGIDGLFGSGVVILLDGHVNILGQLSGDTLGATIAHEVGHQVGLNHTTERDGTSLALYQDVPVCDASFDTNGDDLVDAFECANAGGRNFMFWTTDGGVNDISPEQALVLRRSVAGR